jgi:hypothetical protein
VAFGTNRYGKGSPFEFKTVMGVLDPEGQWLSCVPEKPISEFSIPNLSKLGNRC